MRVQGSGSRVLDSGSRVAPVRRSGKALSASTIWSRVDSGSTTTNLLEAYGRHGALICSGVEGLGFKVQHLRFGI